MANVKHALWVEKYRPQSIGEYVFHDQTHRVQVQRMIADKSIPHILLSGVQGSGKTTLAQILIREMELDGTDVLTINASDERGIDTFRNTIKEFSQSIALGPFKIIHLEEADMLTPPAQSALKRFMEEYSDYVRFILTCNHVNRILAPIRSRCQEFFFRAADQLDVTEYLIKVLAAEGVKFDLNLLDKYIAHGYPDIRKILQLLQQNSIRGVLNDPELDGKVGDYKFQLLDLIVADEWRAARELVCSTVTDDEWEGVYDFLATNLDKSAKFSKIDQWEEGIILIADYLDKHKGLADPEINAAALFIKLGRV